MSSDPFIVAEIGGNHHGSFARAIEIIDAAKEVGADAVKLQTFTPEGMVADRSYVIQEGPWAGQRLYDLYRKTQTPWEWHPLIFDHCRQIGIECFSTPFHTEAVDFLESLGCPRYKVASFEITDIPLIRYIAKTRKPMIISTGMATDWEIGEASAAAVIAGCPNLTLLKCTSAYPAPLSEANLATMQYMRKIFGLPVGLSDHTHGIGAAMVATILGASMIEKHLTLDDEPGPDSHFSLEPARFRDLVNAVRSIAECRAAVGRVEFGPTESEKSSLVFRRSVHVVRDLKQGDEITQESLALRRPALGLDPSRLVLCIGRHATRDISAGTPLRPEMME